MTTHVDPKTAALLPLPLTMANVRRAFSCTLVESRTRTIPPTFAPLDLRTLPAVGGVFGVAFNKHDPSAPQNRTRSTAIVMGLQHLVHLDVTAGIEDTHVRSERGELFDLKTSEAFSRHYAVKCTPGEFRLAVVRQEAHRVLADCHGVVPPLHDAQTMEIIETFHRCGIKIFGDDASAQAMTRERLAELLGWPVEHVEVRGPRDFLLPDGKIIEPHVLTLLSASGLKSIEAHDTAQVPGDQHPQLLLHF